MESSTREIIESRKFLLDMFDVVDDDIGEELKTNSPSYFLKFSDKEQETLVNYCLVAFVPSDYTLKDSSSYGMKHIFENSPTGFYVSNGQFKGAMLMAGFIPVNPHELNWNYKIDKGCFGAGGLFSWNRCIERQTESLKYTFDFLKDIPDSDKEVWFKREFSGKKIKQLNYDLCGGGQIFR